MEAASKERAVRRPCHFLAYDRRRGRLVLAIRGSLEVGDLLTDLHASPTPVTLGGQSCHVHDGMLRAATHVHLSLIHISEPTRPY